MLHNFKTAVNPSASGDLAAFVLPASIGSHRCQSASPALTAVIAVIVLAIPVTLEAKWRPIDDAPFSQIRVVIDRKLTEDEIARVSGCLGYALTETLCGEPLSDPTVTDSDDSGVTVLTFEYDSATSRRTEPNHPCAFQKASYYLTHGTPIRVTDRQGPGSRGTSLVDGLGPDVGFAFLVR